jgi:hypothetical protein
LCRIREKGRGKHAHFQYAQLLEQMKFPLRSLPGYVRVLKLEPHNAQAHEQLNELDVANIRSVLHSALLKHMTGPRP